MGYLEAEDRANGRPTQSRSNAARSITCGRRAVRCHPPVAIWPRAPANISQDRYCDVTSGAIDASVAYGANGAHTSTHQRAWQSWPTRD